MAIVGFAVNPGENYSAECVCSLAAKPEQVFDAAAARILAAGATVVSDVINYETADIFTYPFELTMGQIAAAKAQLVQSIDSERFELDRFVKDVWSCSKWSQVPDRHDEVQHLREIRSRFQNDESVDELIFVVADAMHANHRILSECSILHRDISPYNILFTRDRDCNPTGILIDFDCAVCVADEVAEGPNRTGTGPYMSIANLRQLKFPRTELDDWESLIYALSMMATFGVTTEDRHASRESTPCDISKEISQQKLPIGEWRNSNYYSAGCSKSSHMSSSRSFGKSITDHFLPIASYEPLKRLITDLRDCLFNNPRMSYYGWGTEIKPSYPEATFTMFVTGYDDAGIQQDVASPFARRAACAYAIAGDLCDILDRERKAALERMNKGVSGEA